MSKVAALPRIPHFPDYGYDAQANDVWSFKQKADGRKITFILGWQDDRIFQLHNDKGMHYMADKQIIRLMSVFNACETRKRLLQEVSATQILNTINNVKPAFYVAKIVNGLPAFSDAPNEHKHRESAESEVIRLSNLNPGSEFGIFEFVASGKVKSILIISLSGEQLHKAFVLAVNQDTNLGLRLMAFPNNICDLSTIMIKIMGIYSMGRNVERNTVSIGGYTGYSNSYHEAFFKAFCLKTLGHEIATDLVS